MCKVSCIFKYFMLSVQSKSKQEEIVLSWFSFCFYLFLLQNLNFNVLRVPGIVLFCFYFWGDSQRITSCWWLVRVTWVVGFGFYPKILGRWWDLFCECRWGGGSTWRWWQHLNPTYCNQTCLNFLYSGVGDKKPSFQVLSCPCTVGGGDLSTLHPYELVVLIRGAGDCPYSFDLTPFHPFVLAPLCLAVRLCVLAPLNSGALYPCAFLLSYPQAHALDLAPSRPCAQVQGLAPSYPLTLASNEPPGEISAIWYLYLVFPQMFWTFLHTPERSVNFVRDPCFLLWLASLLSNKSCFFWCMYNMQNELVKFAGYSTNTSILHKRKSYEYFQFVEISSVIMKGLTVIGYFALLVISAEYCAAQDQSASQLEKLLVRLLGKYKTLIFVWISQRSLTH